MILSEKNETLNTAVTKNLTALLDELKRQGVSNAAACKALGKPTSTVNTWKKNGYGANQDHVNTLIAAFPHQLTDKAIDLGIEIPLPSSQSDDVMPVIDELLITVTSLKNKLEELEANKEEKNRLLAENAKLKKLLQKHKRENPHR